MTPRVKQFATDWKSYVGGLAALAAVFSAIETSTEQSIKGIEWFTGLPHEVKWGVAIVLGLIGLVALASALSRRSILVRPERFLIRTELPEHLVGRDDELRKLMATCEKNQLVFLPGESGSGKSALVRAGLVPLCRRAAQDSAPRVLPLYIDGSVLDWKDGLAKEIARGLKEDRVRLLFVCRADTTWAFETVRFMEPALLPPLPRIRTTLISPVLDRLTSDDGQGEVVRDAAFGWDQLKARLLRDLSAGSGEVLAVQLVVAVEALRVLRHLTVGQYERVGRLAGLERNHVEKRVREAASAVHSATEPPAFGPTCPSGRCRKCRLATVGPRPGKTPGGTLPSVYEQRKSVTVGTCSLVRTRDSQRTGPAPRTAIRT